MATWLSLTNDVLRRLRETTVASVSENTYSALIGHLVNRAKAEVEGAWPWLALRRDVTFTSASGTSQYTLSGTNERSYVWARRQIIYDTTNRRRLYPAPQSVITAYTNLSQPQTGTPYYYAFVGLSGTGELVLQLYPTPDSSATITLPMYIPQDDLASDSAVLSAPAEPVRQRAYVLALEERGETGGATFLAAVRDYNLALAQALLRERTLLSNEQPHFEHV